MAEMTQPRPTLRTANWAGWLLCVVLSWMAEATIAAEPVGAPFVGGAQLEPPRLKTKLGFFNEPWPGVLTKVAEATGAQLVMEKAPAGRFTRRDFREYSRSEAVQILNRELEPTGFRLLEQGDFMIVLHLDALRTRYRRGALPTSQAPAVGPNDAVQQSSLSRIDPPRLDRADLEERSSATNAAAPSQPIVVPTPRLGARETARIIYNGLQDRSELVGQGPNLPPLFRVYDDTRSNGLADSHHAGSVQFTIRIDPQGEQLLVDAAPDIRRKLSQLIRYIDAAPADGASEIRLISADEETSRLATELQPALRLMAAQGDSRTARRSYPPDGNVSRQSPAGLGPQGRSQRGPLNVAWQNQPGAQQDQQPATPAQEDATSEPFLQLEGLRGPVTIQNVPGIGMVVTGNQNDVDTVVRLMRELERVAADVEPRIHLLLLRHVSSQALAALLNDVYEELTSVRTAGVDQQPAAAIIPVVRPNAILIVAGAGDLESITDLADKLDQPIDPSAVIEVFSLRTAVASEVVNTLESFYEQQEDEQTIGLQVRIKAVADARTNSVVVQAAPRDLAEIARLIRKIDRDTSAAVNKLRVFPLKNAVADELAEVINTSIQSVLNPPRLTTGAGQFGGGQQAGGDGSAEINAAKSVVLEFLTSGENTGRTIRSGLLADIRVTADPRVNSLIVTASEQSMPLIEALIRQLDEPSSNVAEIKVFAITNGDASAMVDLLEGLFTSEDIQNQTGIEIVGADDASSSLIPLRFSVDIRTNSVIAVGGAEALRVVEAILLRLDAEDVRQRESIVYKLKNSPATDVANAINAFLQSQRELAQIDPELVSNVELLEQEIIVEAEPVSNSLLISATPRYRDEIMDIVQRLDEEPAQVIIQVLIVEVDLQNTDEFGVELGFQDSVLFDRSLTSLDSFLTVTESVSNPGTGVVTTSQRIINQELLPGFLFNNQQLGNSAVNPGSVGTQGLSNFSLGRINGDLGFGGLVLSASSEAVSVLIRALAAQRNVQILSRPQIRTVDNQLAQIQVGQQVPVVSGATTNALGGITPVLGTPQQVGIILQVTPRITPDGIIVMETIANKSRISGQGVPIINDPTTGAVVESPIFDLTEARATVAVPDGQTVVLGGMITKSDDTLERKVPWIGDIPLLGTAFRYDSTSTRRTELLIFMTPRIIRNAADSELIKQVEAERLHFLQNEAEEIHGPIFAVPPESTGGPYGPYWPDAPTWSDEIPSLMPGSPGKIAPPQDDGSVPTTVMPAVPPQPRLQPKSDSAPEGSR